MPDTKRRRAGRSEPAGVPARRLAAEIVGHVLKSRAALDETLDAALGSSKLDDRDASLVRAIATATFRRLGSIRKALDERLETGLPAKAVGLEALLLTGAAQILELDVPDRAAVDVAVGLTRDDNRTAPYGGLVNALLRRLSSEKADLLASRDPLDDLPDWLATSWVGTYGLDRARAIAAASTSEASIDLTVKSDPAGWAERLDGIALPNGSVRLAHRRAITTLDGFESGDWWVQDASAALPATLLGARPDERVLDLCAAPGGKTAQLALTGAEVTAIDRSAKRLERLDANMARLGLSVETLASDALTLDIPPADAILLDAPCSATGTLRRHPDVAWIKSPGDIAKMATLQARLIDKAIDLLKPGGRLVYCTCSLEPQEGESQVTQLLKRRKDVRIDQVEPTEIPGFDAALTPQGSLRILPDSLPNPEPRLAGADGFFAVRLTKSST